MSAVPKSSRRPESLVRQWQYSVALLLAVTPVFLFLSWSVSMMAPAILGVICGAMSFPLVREVLWWWSRYRNSGDSSPSVASSRGDDDNHSRHEQPRERSVVRDHKSEHLPRTLLPQRVVDVVRSQRLKMKDDFRRLSFGRILWINGVVPGAGVTVFMILATHVKKMRTPHGFVLLGAPFLVGESLLAMMVTLWWWRRRDRRRAEKGDA